MRWRRYFLFLGLVVALHVVLVATWPWRAEWLLRAQVEDAVAEIADGVDDMIVARQRGLYSAVLNGDGERIGYVNRDGVHRLGNRVVELLVGERLGGDHWIVEVDDRRGPWPARPEVRAAQDGRLATDCARVEGRLVCWSARRADEHFLTWVAKSSPAPWPW